MITKLQDSSVEKLSGGVETIEYPPVIPAGVIAMLAASPAADHLPFFR